MVELTDAQAEILARRFREYEAAKARQAQAAAVLYDLCKALAGPGCTLHRDEDGRITLAAGEAEVE